MRPFTTLIDAATLASQLGRDDLALFDCRFELGESVRWGEAQYARGAHSRRAVPASRSRSVGRRSRRPAAGIPCPIRTSIRAALGAARGRRRTCQLVAYDQGNGAYAARFWWLARWIGHRAGRGARWRHRRVARRRPAAREPRCAHRGHATLPVRLDAGRAGSTASTVDALRLRPGTLLVDARGAERFAGRNETIDPVAGHVPGARNCRSPAISAPTADSCRADELRRRWATLLGSRPPSAVVAMCGSGVTACHNLLALEHAGLPGARLYAGSWSEWIRDPRRPIATGTY